MKEIKAIIQPFMLTKVMNALREFDGLPGATVSEVIGFGKARCKDAEDKVVLESGEYVKKSKLELVVSDKMVEPVVNLIASHAQTGNPGDGKIFVVTVDEVVKVRTGERGDKAI